MKMIKSIIKKINKDLYFKMIGIKYGTNCEFLGNINWGSEPYLIEIGSHVRITDGVKFVTHDGGVWIYRIKKEFENIDLFGKIKIGNNVHIGFNSIIMPNVEIGNNVIVGCGAVVTKNLPSNGIYAGVPAKLICSYDEYLEKHKNDFDYTKKMSKKEKREYLIKKYKI